MTNIMNYNGYSARIEFDSEDEIFFGRIVGILTAAAAGRFIRPSRITLGAARSWGRNPRNHILAR